ncbi:Receptor-like protein kinase [Thalictrum thalictroides]|uniref:Receptor-like protein kinase n=1 Tax=Thalictrum thalictroides TaxID=46969 RepID=A0A7J6VWQ1_THATH|nr:Receptor-like protein kinase [Thalictrum thalictroides]
MWGSKEAKVVMFNNKLIYAETVEATRQFDEENVLISRVLYGLLFKACFLDGTVRKEGVFRKEAREVKHRNLTVLQEYYAGPPNVRFLVYDYMPSGNLATLLQEASHQDGQVLNWPMLHLIVLGVAWGLAFLHTSTLVHSDIKPQNVLFNADF